MKTFLWVNAYAILVGISCYAAGVLTGGVVRILVEDSWTLVKDSILIIIETFGKIFGRR